MTTPHNVPGATARPNGSGTQSVGDQMKGAAGEVKDAAGQAVEQAQQTAGKVVDQAKQQATSQITTQKERAAGSLGSVAQAIRQTGQELRGQDQDVFGRYADNAAQQVERFASYLRDRDVSELFDDVEDVARRQPGLFLGGAVALGFLGSRFLMSSGRRAARRQQALTPPAVTPRPYRPMTGGLVGEPPAPYRAVGQRPVSAGTSPTAPGAGLSTGPSTGAGQGTGTTRSEGA